MRGPADRIRALRELVRSPERPVPHRRRCGRVEHASGRVRRLAPRRRDRAAATAPRRALQRLHRPPCRRTAAIARDRRRFLHRGPLLCRLRRTSAVCGRARGGGGAERRGDSTPGATPSIPGPGPTSTRGATPLGPAAPTRPRTRPRGCATSTATPWSGARAASPFPRRSGSRPRTGRPAVRARARAVYALNTAWLPIEPATRSHHLGFRCVYDSPPPELRPWGRTGAHVRIEGGEYPVGLPPDVRLARLAVILPDAQLREARALLASAEQAPRRIEVERCEVSRREYRAFLADPLARSGLFANPREPEDEDYVPDDWERQSAHLDLPVSGMSVVGGGRLRALGGGAPAPSERVAVAGGGPGGTALSLGQPLRHRGGGDRRPSGTRAAALPRPRSSRLERRRRPPPRRQRLGVDPEHRHRPRELRHVGAGRQLGAAGTRDRARLVRTPRAAQPPIAGHRVPGGNTTEGDSPRAEIERRVRGSGFPVLDVDRLAP